MALKDLLIYFDRTRDSTNRLRLGVDLAARHGSRLTAIYVREWDQSHLHERRTAEMGRLSGADMARLERRVATAMDEEADEYRSVLEALGRQAGLVTEWRPVDGPASITVPQHARYADLCVLGHHRRADEDPNSYTFSEKLLFSSGRPSLFIPPGYVSESLGRHIVVAWNSSRAAARSVNDALPLIERAERVTILTVNQKDFIVRNKALPADRLVDNLQRHGAPVELVQLDHIATGAIGDTLQVKARSLGADLVVAGAFGNPRLTERLLGGATRDLLDRMNLPIVMSN